MLHNQYNFQTEIHQTTSHRYKDRIGNGSSCDVYLGFEKGTGNKRALKILKDRSWDRELMKEADSLLKLKRHPNIVEFYGKEKDLQTKQSCLIIEYCSGGSLHTFLKEVSNIHGLPDLEFLILLEHITSGLEHLRQHNCIHRDIKPGNILRHVTSDKRTIYKLSDFGASRIMRNCDEEFMSLAGTEEYLHPAMYEKAFVNRKSSATFNHSADLWSLGCTLYQAVTGAMPFVPFDGARNNRTTMYEMVACKPNGAISGSQTSSDSPISWDYSLPTNSNMTRSLQKYILRVLVGLLEADPSKQWSFIQYKDTVTVILKLTNMVVLNCDDKTVHEMYLNPTSRLVELEEEIARVTDIPAANQKLYFQQHRIDVFMSGKRNVQQFPKTSLQDPLLLFSQTTDNNTELTISLDPYPTFHSNATIVTDISTATSQSEMINTVLKKMQTQKCVITGLYAAVFTMWNNTQYKHYRIEKKYQPWFEIYRQIRSLFDTTKAIFGGHIKNGMKTTLEQMNTFEFYDRLKSVKNRIENTGHEQLFFQTSEESDKDWLQLTKAIFERSQELIHQMQARKKSTLNDYEICLHQSDKIEMQELTARCIDYWQTCCAEERKKAAQLYSKNKRLYITVMRKMVEIERDLVDLEELRKKCHSKFSEVLTQILGKSPDMLRKKREAVQPRSLMEALPECKPTEDSVKASKSSPLPRSRSPKNDILEENKAFSIKFEDSIKQVPEVYTVDLDDIDCFPPKQTSRNQPVERSSSQSQSPEKKSPGCNSPVNVSTGIETHVNKSSVKQKSPGNDSPVNVSTMRHKSPGNESSEKQSSMSPSPVDKSPVLQTKRLYSSIGQLSASSKQPCESSDIVETETDTEKTPGPDFSTFTNFDGNTNRAKNSNENLPSATNEHVFAKAQVTDVRRNGKDLGKNKKMVHNSHSDTEDDAVPTSKRPLSSSSIDSGFCTLPTFKGNKKDIEIDAIEEEPNNSKSLEASNP